MMAYAARFYRLIRAEFAHRSQSRARARYRNYVMITWRDYVGLYHEEPSREPFERASAHGRINRMRREAKRAASARLLIRECRNIYSSKCNS